MCSKIVNGVETVWDCGFSKEITCGWKCEVCGEHAGGSLRYFDLNSGDEIQPDKAKELIDKGGSVEYLDRQGRIVVKGW